LRFAKFHSVLNFKDKLASSLLIADKFSKAFIISLIALSCSSVLLATSSVPAAASSTIVEISCKVTPI